MTTYLGPPFHGVTRLGHTYRSENRPHIRSCPDMLAFYGDCFYHPYPAVDFGLHEGKPIRAVTDGVVAVVGEGTDDAPHPWPRRPGRFVLLEHAAEASVPPVTAYKHLSDWAVVEGEAVVEGQIIGFAGHTQIDSGVPHLHFDAFDSVAGFNHYAHQVDYGTFRWRNAAGQQVRRDVTTLFRGETYAMYPY